MRLRTLAAMAALACAFCGVAHADSVRQQTYPDINRWAAMVAMNPSEVVECRLPSDDGSLDGAWGYTLLPFETLGAVDSFVVDSRLCNAVENLTHGRPFNHRLAALGVLVVTHEAYHARAWDLRGNEAAVECRAYRHWRTGMRVLGVAPQVIETLFPWAVAEHYLLVRRNGEYWSPDCQGPVVNPEA